MKIKIYCEIQTVLFVNAGCLQYHRIKLKFHMDISNLKFQQYQYWIVNTSNFYCKEHIFTISKWKIPKIRTITTYQVNQSIDTFPFSASIRPFSILLNQIAYLWRSRSCDGTGHSPRKYYRIPYPPKICNVAQTYQYVKIRTLALDTSMWDGSSNVLWWI